MNKLVYLLVDILSTTALINALDRPIRITNQTVDSGKAHYTVWTHKNYATLFKKQVVGFEIVSSPARLRNKKIFFVEPLPHIPLMPIREVDKY